MGNATKDVMMTDEELCNMLRISSVTLRKHLREGPPRKNKRSGVNDIRLIRHFHVGGRRRWVKESVDEFVNGK
jgi:hypothetical protein